MKTKFRQFFSILTYAQEGAKRQFMLLILAKIIISLADLVGIAAVVAVVSTALEPGKSQVLIEKIHSGFFINLSEDEFILAVLAACLFFFVAKNFLAFLVHKLTVRFAQNVSNTLSQHVIEGFFKRGYSYLFKERIFKLTHRSVAIPFEFGTAVVKSMFSLAGEVAVLVFFIAMAFVANWVLSIVLVIITIPISYAVYKKLAVSYSQLGKQKHEILPQNSRGIHKLFDSFLEMKVYGAVEQFTNTFMRNLRAFNGLRFKQQELQIAPKKIMEIAAISFILLLFVFQHYFDSEGNVGMVFNLGILGAYGYKVMPAIGLITDSLLHFKSTEHLVQELEQNLENHSIPEVHFKEVVFDNSIVLEGVSVAFEDHKVLQNIDMAITKGSIVGVKGKSGAGKSTLLKVIIGLQEIDSGKIRIDGMEPEFPDNSKWLSKISYIGQDSVILDASVYENVSFGYPITNTEKIEQALKMACLDEFIGNDRFVGEDGKLLSSGQKQRIALARAMYFERPLMVLDEFSANLDSHTEAGILETIQHINQQLGVTILLVSHRMKTLGIAAHIWELSHGKLHQNK
ncbi:ATP-binding cassette domain-containing protein [bacterium]|nr:ATP-binding cassette domain-containing protein [bacterium]